MEACCEAPEQNLFFAVKSCGIKTGYRRKHVKEEISDMDSSKWQQEVSELGFLKEFKQILMFKPHEVPKTQAADKSFLFLMLWHTSKFCENIDWFPN